MGGWRAGALAVCAVAATALPGQAAHAADVPTPYAFAPDARPVTGAVSTTGAKRLDAGKTYKSSLPASGKLYYRLELDPTSDAYVSATAVPRAGTTVSATDGIRVSVRDANSRLCSAAESVYFGTSRSPHPIAAWGAREAFSQRTSCQGAGTYYVLVERLDRAGSSTDTWDLELAPMSEPRLKQTGATTAPEAWNSASPAPLTSEAVSRPGGAGFATATSMGQGVWSADMTPGQTFFYKVPVDWGRQLYVTAELGSLGSDARGYVPGALTASLYNPARGHLDDVGIGYDGRQKSESLEPLPPVEYVNRYAVSDRVNGMRVAGSYYLVVHLSAGMAEEFGDGPFGMTLRVRIGGTTEASPAYAGQSRPQGVFEVAGQGGRDGGTASEAATAEGGAAGDDAVMKAVAVAGIGAGTVLLAVLGAWTLVARRRAGAW
ncbi:hypothetical protein [Streptomyces fulvoviolaceus]|uniref:hypothetical protein n=1 Tax=Streptomyces fulvoviolaceus TaxID=285535 RepID=UPI001F357EBD|nr:hypothetical protein [Streptomyces fulvoviolaceus]